MCLPNNNNVLLIDFASRDPKINDNFVRYIQFYPVKRAILYFLMILQWMQNGCPCLNLPKSSILIYMLCMPRLG